jgi:hypothetical protein
MELAELGPAQLVQAQDKVVAVEPPALVGMQDYMVEVVQVYAQ